jgi:hypothetical protein
MSLSRWRPRIGLKSMCTDAASSRGSPAAGAWPACRGALADQAAGLMTRVPPCHPDVCLRRRHAQELWGAACRSSALGASYPALQRSVSPLHAGEQRVCTTARGGSSVNEVRRSQASGGCRRNDFSWRFGAAVLAYLQQPAASGFSPHIASQVRRSFWLQDHHPDDSSCARPTLVKRSCPAAVLCMLRPAHSAPRLLYALRCVRTL